MAITLDKLSVADMRDLHALLDDRSIDQDLSLTDALAELRSRRERKAEGQADNQRLQREIDAWIKGRDAAGRDAAERTKERLREKGFARIQTGEAIAAAARRAMTRYEADVPRPTRPNGEPACALLPPHKGTRETTANVGLAPLFDTDDDGGDR